MEKTSIFLKLKGINNEQCLINVDNISTVHQESDQTRIAMQSGYTMRVRESIDFIVSFLELHAKVVSKLPTPKEPYKNGYQ